jgi:hypothetical protein
VLLAVPAASAADLYAQTADNTGYALVDFGQQIYVDSGVFVSPPRPAYTTFSEVNLKLSANPASSDTYNFVLFFYDNSSNMVCKFSWNTKPFSTLSLDKTTVPFLLSTAVYDSFTNPSNGSFCTSSSVTLNGGIFRGRIDGTADTSFKFWGSTSPIYSPLGFSFITQNAYGNVIPQTPFITLGLAAPPTPTISITAPVGSSSIIETAWPSQNWVFNASNWPTFHLYNIIVCYGLSSGVDCYNYDYGGTSPALQYSITNPPGWTSTGGLDTIQILKRELLPIGNYYARVFVKDLSFPYDWLASSSEVNFNIVSSLPGAPPPPPPPPVVTCGDLDFVCQFQQWFSTQLQTILSYIFVPSTSSVSQWATLWDPIKTKVPIGYVTSLVTAFGSLSDSGTPTFMLASMAALTSLRTPLDTVIGVILWIFIAFWLLRRVAKMEL